MRLFDEIDRVNPSPMRHAEPQFHFLNNSAMEGMEVIRVVLADWFSRYPTADQRELRMRFRSNIDRHHSSAFFELFLHEFLLGLGCKVTIHPEPSPETPKRPDFLVRAPDGTEFYVEAVIVSGTSDAELAIEKRINEVYDLINKIDSPSFVLHIMDLIPGALSPPTGRMRNLLTAWLASLDPDDFQLAGHAPLPDDLPRFEFKEGDWEWVFQAIPLRGDARGQADMPVIGIYPMEGPPIGMPITSHEAVREALNRKSSRYGTLSKPYIIALNGLDSLLYREGLLRALFGDQCYRFDRNDLAAKGQCDSIRNGFWTGPTAPAHTRVSGVLAFLRLAPCNIHWGNPIFYHNPWASLPLPATALEIPQLVREGDLMVERAGRSIEDILDLPPSWPWEEILMPSELMAAEAEEDALEADGETDW